MRIEKHNSDKKNYSIHSMLHQPTELPSSLIAQQWQLSVPLHHPDILKKYSEINPEYPERILNMVEIEQAQKHKLENEELRQNSNKINKIFIERLLGLIFGFVIGTLGIGAGIYIILNGYSVTGTALSGATLCSLVYVFIRGTKKST